MLSILVKTVVSTIGNTWAKSIADTNTNTFATILFYCSLHLATFIFSAVSC